MSDGLKLSRKAVRDLLKDPALEKHLLAEAERIAARAGEGHKASSMIGRNRARASVITDSFSAMYHEAKSGRLSKAAGLG
jgi:pantoate kinase